MASILLIEDYPSIQALYEQVLQQAGHKVVIEADGKAALKLSRREHFDLILLDILLPSIDGLQFLKQFDCQKHPETLVIITSNLDDPKLRQQAIEAGAAAYVIKANLTPKQLLQKIEAVLAHR